LCGGTIQWGKGGETVGTFGCRRRGLGRSDWAKSGGGRGHPEARQFSVQVKGNKDSVNSTGPSNNMRASGKQKGLIRAKKSLIEIGR